VAVQAITLSGMAKQGQADPMLPFQHVTSTSDLSLTYF